MMMKALIFAMAVAACTAVDPEEISLSMNDASLVGSCTDTLSHLMTKKADVLSKLASIATKGPQPAEKEEKQNKNTVAAPNELGER